MVAWAFSDVLQPLFSAIVSWFNQIVNRLSAGSVIVAAVAIVLTVSFLIMPLRGAGMGNVISAGSDFAHRSRKQMDKESE